MSYKTMLVHADTSASASHAINVAAQLAIMHEAHLIGVASTGIDQFIQQSSLFPPGIPVQLSDLGFLKQRAEAALAGFEATVARLGVPSYEKRSIDEELGEGLALHARYADLLVVGQADPHRPLPDQQPGLPQQVVLHACRPVLMVPYTGRFDHIGRHALVAWDGSIEASRTIGAALPLLRRAALVTLAIFNPYARYQVHGEQPGADLALYLARHGIVVEVRQEDTPFDVGDCLLSMAADIGADLLVMGGYGHSRFREVALGGVTRTILQTMTLPVLMAH